MIRPIMKDVAFLSLKSEEATPFDLPVGKDLQDTLAAHRAHCVGMAANMIGVRKNVIIANVGADDVVMFNPVIVSKSSPYDTEEGCLSLEGARPTVRYEAIEVEYLDANWKKHREKFSGFAAQVIQHEVDHLFGIII